jgi:hypothetical protein
MDVIFGFFVVLVIRLLAGVVTLIVRANPTTLCLDCANSQLLRKAYSARIKTYCKRNSAVTPLKFVVVECSDYVPRTAPAVPKRVCGFGCSGCSD